MIDAILDAKVAAQSESVGYELDEAKTIKKPAKKAAVKKADKSEAKPAAKKADKAEEKVEAKPAAKKADKADKKDK